MNNTAHPCLSMSGHYYPNHFHILCKTGTRLLSSSMRKLLTGLCGELQSRLKSGPPTPLSESLTGQYREFVEQGIALGNRPELVGWFEVLAMRKMGIREASDQRIRGDGTFVGQVLEEMNGMGRENLRMTPR